jgi:dTDP-glucose pyrophosphorylase
MATRYETCRVSLSGTLRDASWALERGEAQIALVTDGDNLLKGVLTDGDIRRALLAGSPLDAPLAPFVKDRFVTVGPEASRAEVLDLMQGRTIEQIPIVDAKGALLGLHLLHEILGGVERPNWAVVMAGGQGVRLRPLTNTVPKPMLLVAGRPILERIVLHLVGAGIRRVFLSVNYLGDVIERHFGDGQRFGCRIEYLKEAKPLGTGGSLSLLPSPPRTPLLVLNGDLITQCPVGRLLDFHARGRHAATIGLADYSHTVPFGVVTVNNGTVEDLQEKPTFTWQANAGVYALEPAVLAQIPRDVPVSMPEVVQGCLDRGQSVGAFSIAGEHIDVGRTSELARARGELTPGPG